MRNMQPRIIILLFLITAGFFSGGVTAQSPIPKTIAQQRIRPIPDKDILRGIELLYNWDFDRAETIFQKYMAKNPDEPLGYFYNAMVTWSRLASGFWSPETVREYEQRVDRTVSIAEVKIEKGEADSFTYFYMGGALGFKGRLHLMEHEWLPSFKLALRAVESLEKCHELDPDNKDVLLGLGIYDYYTARLSGFLKFMSYLFIRKGDAEEGLHKLDTAANEAVYAAVEAKSVLIHIYLFMESRYDRALPLALELTNRFENNPRFIYFLGLAYLKLNRDDDYRSILRMIRERGKQSGNGIPPQIWKHRALYLESCHDMFLKHYGRAREKLEIILKEADSNLDPSMAVFPLLKIGMSYDLEGERDKALGCYHKIIEMDNGAGAQFLAERYTGKPPEPDDPFLGY